jgi:hypothetical protein
VNSIPQNIFLGIPAGSNAMTSSRSDTSSPLICVLRRGVRKESRGVGIVRERIFLALSGLVDAFWLIRIPQHNAQHQFDVSIDMRSR